MNLHEYQAKQLLAQAGLPVSLGIVCTTPQQALAATDQLGGDQWVVKCQVHAGGRGKVGGVKLLRSRQAVGDFAQQWLGQRLVTNQTDEQGQLVSQILVDHTLDIEQELYLGAVVDRNTHRITFMASTAGGVDIEEVAQQTPHLIHQVSIDPLTGPQPFQGRQLAFQLGLTASLVHPFSRLFMELAKLFISHDLALIEINPLVITPQGQLHCLDAKLVVEDNALFRQPELRQLRDVTQADAREAEAAEWELNYVALTGNVGCMVNGAGLAMATMDMVQLHGGLPANFLDVGGSATQERVVHAFKLILSDPNIEAVLVNIFGGIVRCDLIADGIIAAVAEVGAEVPVVVRLQGNNSLVGAAKLAESGLNIIAQNNLDQAAAQVVAAAKSRPTKRQACLS